MVAIDTRCRCPPTVYQGEIKICPIPPHPPFPLPALVTMAIPTFISQYPGVLWLMFSLPRIVAPAFLVYILISSSLGFLVGWDPLDGSRWKVAVASALTFPFAFFCSIIWNRLRIAFWARRLGATTPSVVAGRLPGSLDIVWQFSKARFTAYPGEQALAGVVSRARRLLPPRLHVFISGVATLTDLPFDVG